VAAAVLLAAAGTAAWWFTREPEAAAAPAGHNHAAMAPAEASASPVMLTADAARRIGVTYAVAARGPLAADIRTVGLVTYDETRVATIAPKVDGYVEELFVNYTGQLVRAGDPLLRIYSPMLVTAQDELLLARKLASDVGTDSSDASRHARTLLESARRRLRYWDVPDDAIAALERTGRAEKTLTLRSPITGVAVKKNVLAGQRIMAGDATYQVADLSEVWLEGEVFERDLAAVRVGQTVTADFDALPGDERRGRIVFVAPTVTQDTRTVQVRVALPNGDEVLKPGMYATIHIRGTAGPPVVHVPRTAVLVTGTRSLVFVKTDDGMLTPRDVELGITTDDRVEVRRGLAAGETVVASATFLVDAESNLGSALAGMAAMPGMDMGPPAAPAAPVPQGKAGAKSPDMPDMPGMQHGATPPKKP
ncbi:MAG: efflux RND transporter periplasmic adaptor subunit, partial [Gemmatimonadota bacterium]|nr:efflux RND transporter periplasmic adaptor subunit [Gemmatimonadota bacterium]